MCWWGGYLLLIIGVLGLAALTRSPNPTPRNGLMELPADYRQTFVHYATVDRSDNVVRYLYIDPVSLAQVQQGVPLPEGTRIVIEAYEGVPNAKGELVPTTLFPFIHMAEKRSNWRLDELQTSAHVGDWNFASFTPDGQFAPPEIVSENITDCFTCHDASAAPSRDFIFSRRIIDLFLSNPTEPQYQQCPLPDRNPCR